MKAKRILITYLNNGNMASQVGKEILFQQLLTELVEEGREVGKTTLQPNSKSVKFSDGSTLSLFPLGIGMKGFRSTHLYIDEAVNELGNSDGLINQVLLPTLMTGEYEKYDTDGKQVQTFTFANGELKIN